ncbi:MAG: SIMPL domain-containing protein, partial [Bradyrhizobium sp.]|nr:SIMPL domain-containing protein [Bradyrhizobium sp.]
MKTMKFCVLSAALLAATLATPALAQAEFPPAISVSGEGTVSVPPDLAQIDAGVATDAKTAKEAAEANNVAMSKVLAALKGTGIDEKDFQTSRLSLQPQYAPNRTGPPSSVTGYRASNRVTIKLHDLTKVASVIDTLVAAGAND